MRQGEGERFSPLPTFYLPASASGMAGFFNDWRDKGMELAEGQEAIAQQAGANSHCRLRSIQRQPLTNIVKG